MAFQVSPGVQIREIDLTTSLQAVSTGEGAFSGAFTKGPVEEVVTINSETSLLENFGKPNSTTTVDFHVAASFLQYSSNLKVVRVVDDTVALNATSGNTENSSTWGVLVKNSQIFDDTPTFSSGNYSGGIIAKYPGSYGNSIKISICDTPDALQKSFTTGYNLTLQLGNSSIATATSLTSYVTPMQTIMTLPDGDDYYVKTVNSSIITLADSKGVDKVYSGATTTSSTFKTKWRFFNNISTPSFTDSSAAINLYPSGTTGDHNIKDSLHIVIYDTDGKISGVSGGGILETYEFLSKASDGKSEDGVSNYYYDVINNNSNYIYVTNHEPLGGTNWGGTIDGRITDNTITAFSSTTKPIILALKGGVDGNTLADDDRVRGFNKFANTEDEDVSFLIAGDVSSTVGNHVVNIADSRKDCMAFVSPLRSDVINNSDIFGSIIDFKDASGSYPSTSYAVMDSGFKQTYDIYNGNNIFVPLCADTAGLTARTEVIRDYFFSPAGFVRGVLATGKLSKLLYNPSKSDRDELYKRGINPIVNFPGQGTILFGDKTLLSRPSSFDRINVRRLFVVVEKTIATFAKFSMFEFNDIFTRSQFVATIEPFLRDLKARRGIYDFKIVCDETNNTAAVIDRNEFRGDIYIKPSKSINFIQLNFVAVSSGVDFNEVVGTV